MIKAGAYDVEVLNSDCNLIVRHKRLYGEERESMIWIPYLELMAKRPTALKYTGLFNLLPLTLKQFLENSDYECKKQTLKVFAHMTADTNMTTAVTAIEEGSDVVPEMLTACGLHIAAYIPEVYRQWIYPFRIQFRNLADSFRILISMMN